MGISMMGISLMLSQTALNHVTTATRLNLTGIATNLVTMTTNTVPTRSVGEILPSRDYTIVFLFGMCLGLCRLWLIIGLSAI